LLRIQYHEPVSLSAAAASEISSLAPILPVLAVRLPNGGGGSQIYLATHTSVLPFRLFSGRQCGLCSRLVHAEESQIVVSERINMANWRLTVCFIDAEWQLVVLASPNVFCIPVSLDGSIENDLGIEQTRELVVFFAHV